jgi:hypothetical protein
MFKSFKLKRYTRSKGEYSQYNKQMKEFCNKCGTPFGEHYGSHNLCPPDASLKTYKGPRVKSLNN